MKNLIIKDVELAPSKNINPDLLYKQFNWRKTGKFEGIESIILYCSNMQEPIWWNRPLESDTLVKQEADGLYSYNLPYIWKNNLFKTKYNILVPINSVPIIGQLKVNKSWTAEQKQKLHRFIVPLICDTLEELGIESAKLRPINNDLKYENKKFLGCEDRLDEDWFSFNYVITLEYTPEKEIFERLTGKYALAKPLTGIIEATGYKFTKQQFIEILIKKIQSFLDTYE